MSGVTGRTAAIEDESMNQGFRRRGEVGDFTAPDVTFTGRARYEDHHYVLEACCMGSPAAPVLVASCCPGPRAQLHGRPGGRADYV